ncbi:MAG: ABC transporter substrate-binding protein [Eubacteriales bacterium]|nr:ABC transporter substrate-binding protein [Eubacteriales bacterium]
MKALKKWMSVALIVCICCLTGCSSSAESESTGGWADMTPTGSMELQYANQFSVDYYDGGYSLITIGDTDQFLLVPEGKDTPEGLDSDITVLQQPIANIYVAASSAMDLFCGLDSLDAVRMTSTALADWSLPEIQQAMENEDILYVGKYNTPDYETVISENCSMAIESTMIYHNPETQEQLESLGIPVMVERSSYESHPLGRMEWIKLYGLLLGKTEEAVDYFDQKVTQLDDILTGSSTGKTVAFFYISSNGYANVRKPGDYISKMIELAGGSYVLSADDLNVDENALSTMNMQMEAFYAAAKDADYLIYNSTIDGELQTIDQLLDKSALLADFKAVKEGNVWCTEKNMFQQTTGAADMITDLHTIVTGEASGSDQLTFLHRLH